MQLKRPFSFVDAGLFTIRQEIAGLRFLSLFLCLGGSTKKLSRCSAKACLASEMRKDISVHDRSGFNRMNGPLCFRKGIKVLMGVT